MKSIPLLDALNQRMRWLSARQQVISQNIAHANTPGFKPQDLKEQDFSALVDQVGKTSSAKPNLKVNNARHLNATGVMAQTIASETNSEFREVTPNENAVVLEDELVKMADVQMEYNLMLNVYRKHMGILRSALGSNRG